ncbi:MAG TPA: hypothetical protein VKX96_10235 [Chloroflexota bacterium]|jgi:hypothetical protein|nr:hypothetical protein [Chloroflexota bacterium]
MKLRLPWQKAESVPTAANSNPVTCTHPSVDVEMHGTVVKRRWCKVCGQELPVQDRSAHDV